MPDAEVIPLGTRGRPGRGSGSAKPSSAARTLATGGRGIPAPRVSDDPGTGRGADGAAGPGEDIIEPTSGRPAADVTAAESPSERAAEE